MIGALIGAGVSALGSVFGGLSASAAMRDYYKQARAGLKSQEARNQGWYDRNYYQPATERGDAQALLTRTEESIRRRNAQAAGRQAVTGGTEESTAAAKAANNEALADAASRIVAAGEARKDRIEEKYLDRANEINSKLQELRAQKALGKAQSVSQAVQGVAGAAGNLGMALDEYRDTRGGDATQGSSAGNGGGTQVTIPEIRGESRHDGGTVDVIESQQQPWSGSWRSDLNQLA